MNTRLENTGARKGILTFAVLIFLISLFTASELCAFGKFQNYPRDGKFKQLSADNDQWYFIDKNNWYIQAPDKFQHMMGSYVLFKTTDIMMDKYLAAGVTLGLGIYKEYDDAYREGWSPRDLLMNTLGVMTGWINNDKYKIWMDWENDAIVLKLGISFK
jgi:hypothetical protein